MDWDALIALGITLYKYFSTLSLCVSPLFIRAGIYLAIK